MEEDKFIDVNIPNDWQNIVVKEEWDERDIDIDVNIKVEAEEENSAPTCFVNFEICESIKQGPAESESSLVPAVDGYTDEVGVHQLGNSIDSYDCSTGKETKSLEGNRVKSEKLDKNSKNESSGSESSDRRSLRTRRSLRSRNISSGSESSDRRSFRTRRSLRSRNISSGSESSDRRSLQTRRSLRSRKLSSQPSETSSKSLRNSAHNEEPTPVNECEIFSEKPGHSKKTQFKCDQCKKSFPRKSGLATHMRVHAHQCKECGTLFSFEQDLDTHMSESHFEETVFGNTCLPKSYECENCGKIYIKELYFKSHLPCRNAANSYSCKICGKTFGLRINLRMHSKTHLTSSEEIQGCTALGNIINKRGLGSHLKTHVNNSDWHGLLIVGDSILKKMQIKNKLETYKNLLQNGKPEQVIQAVGTMQSRLKPKIVIVHAGTFSIKLNRIGEIVNKSKVAVDITDLIKLTKCKFKDSKILISGITYRRDVILEDITWINDEVSTFCVSENVAFVDPTPLIGEKDICLDGLNLNAKGLKKLATLFKRIVERETRACRITGKKSPTKKEVIKKS